MPQTLDWLLHVSSRVFGVRFEAAAVPVWHEDVRYYDVIDEATRHPHRRHLLRPLPARRQVHARCRVAGARREHAGGAHADHGDGRQLRPQRPHAQRGGDVLPRVRPRAARRALGDALQPARRHERGARLRGGALADLRGMDAPSRDTRDHSRGVPRLPGHGRGHGRPAERRPPVRRGHAVRAAAPVCVVRHDPLRRAARSLRSRRGRPWSRRRRWGSCRARTFQPPSRTSPVDTPPATTATCGRRSSPSTCCRRSGAA